MVAFDFDSFLQTTAAFKLHSDGDTAACASILISIALQNRPESPLENSPLPYEELFTLLRYTGLSKEVFWKNTYVFPSLYRFDHENVQSLGPNDLKEISGRLRNGEELNMDVIKNFRPQEGLFYVISPLEDSTKEPVRPANPDDYYELSTKERAELYMQLFPDGKINMQFGAAPSVVTSAGQKWLKAVSFPFSDKPSPPEL